MSELRMLQAQLPFAVVDDTEAIIHSARHHLDRLWSLARDACKEEPDLDRSELKSAIDDAVHNVQQSLYTAETYVDDFCDWARELRNVRSTMTDEATDAAGSPESGVVPVTSRCAEVSS